MELNLPSLRHEIDRLDNRILQTLQKRLEIARLVVKFKREQNQDVNVPEREQQILDSLKGRERSLLSAEVIEEIYRTIFKESKRLQSESKPLIAFQGEHGAFSEVAARKWNPELAPIPCLDINDVFHGVEVGSFEYGIVPIENTVGGMMSQINACLMASRLFIVGAIEMSVEHALLIKPGTDYYKLRRVYSQAVALTECHSFVKRMNLEPVPYYDTAGAAKMLAEKTEEDSAAIASELAAKYYNLEILKTGIADSKNTRTRFLILARNPLENGGNRCSIIFTMPNTPGSLFRVMEMFSKENINLTRITSIPTEQGNYAFFLDFAASADEERVKDILNQISCEADSYRYLGCYAEVNQLN
ncbi:MAG: ACT domain-containing protein [Planctomycetaceae bacterium]|nr:ACT domain-containing protein [Planctomycetaceae bacterium]MBQ2821437.1 chorismate mutase [Thermoguttaceae bacterium]